MIFQAIIAAHLLIPILAIMYVGIRRERRRLSEEKVRLWRYLMIARGKRH